MARIVKLGAMQDLARLDRASRYALPTPARAAPLSQSALRGIGCGNSIGAPAGAVRSRPWRSHGCWAGPVEPAGVGSDTIMHGAKTVTSAVAGAVQGNRQNPSLIFVDMWRQTLFRESNPDGGTDPISQVMQRLRSGGAYPGVVRDDTAVFTAAQQHGLLVLTFQAALSPPSFRTFRRKLEAGCRAAAEQIRLRLPGRRR